MTKDHTSSTKNERRDMSMKNDHFTFCSLGTSYRRFVKMTNIEYIFILIMIISIYGM